MSRRHVRWGSRYAALALALTCVVACGDDAEPAADAGSTEPEPDAGGPGPNESSAEPTTVEGLRAVYQQSVLTNELSFVSTECPEPDATDVECATVTIPLSWQQPILGLISLLTRRLPAQGELTRQVWLLGDGPGQSSAALLERARSLVASSPGTEVLWLDYRGVGGSERLACPSEEDASGRLSGIDPPSSEAAERIDRCFRESRIRWAADIFLFSLTETAADLAALVEARREPELPVFFYGLGWGASVAHEYLHILPEGVDGVVLDSLAPPDFSADRDQAADAVVRSVLAACGADAACADRAGAGTERFGEAALDWIDDGECPALADIGLDGYGLRRLLGRLAAQPSLWGFVPIALYRAVRCTSADVDALESLLASVEPPAQSEPALQASDQLALLQWAAQGEPGSVDDVSSAQTGLFALDGRAGLVTSYAEVIPWREPNAFAGSWADTDMPMLVLGGGMDAALLPSAAAAAAERFQGASQQHIAVPHAGAGFGLDHTCGQGIVAAWLRGTDEPLETECIDSLVVDLTVTEATALERLGDTNAWGE